MHEEEVLVALDKTFEQSRHGRWAIFSADMKIKESKTKSPHQENFPGISGMASKITEFRKGEPIYCQGDPANSVMYIQTGNVKLSVVNGSGKEAVVAMFGPSDFFGEGCMAGQPVRTGTATAITPTAILSIDKNELLHMLHTRPQAIQPFCSSICSNHNNPGR